jgi:hypothetical protein
MAKVSDVIVVRCAIDTTQPLESLGVSHLRESEV